MLQPDIESMLHAFGDDAWSDIFFVLAGFVSLVVVDRDMTRELFGRDVVTAELKLAAWARILAWSVGAEAEQVYDTTVVFSKAVL